MLASAGLLKGKKCSAHWNYANKLSALLANVNLQADELIIDKN
jgi:transcriptional regulator GlxA family with amidase domain